MVTRLVTVIHIRVVVPWASSETMDCMVAIRTLLGRIVHLVTSGPEAVTVSNKE